MYFRFTSSCRKSSTNPRHSSSFTYRYFTIDSQYSLNGVRMAYVDGFVIVIPKKNIAAYRKMAKIAGEVWKEYGALDYKECVGEDLKVKYGTPYPKLLKIKPTETVIFSYITYKSRAQRDKINAKVIQDARIKDSCEPDNMPFEMKRMSYGGFDVIVDPFN